MRCGGTNQHGQSQRTGSGLAAVLAVLMSLLLFVPAGTIRYWQAWATHNLRAPRSSTLDLMSATPRCSSAA
jgi:hypothetical protein